MSDIDVISAKEKETILAFFDKKESKGGGMIYKLFSIGHLSPILEK